MKTPPTVTALPEAGEVLADAAVPRLVPHPKSRKETFMISWRYGYSSKFSERASNIKGLSGVVAYRFCAWETVGKLFAGGPARHLAFPPKTFRE
jgi:hypothetical protein